MVETTAVKLSDIPVEELLSDLRESVADIVLCGLALSLGIETYGDSQSVVGRLQGNIAINAIVGAELERRNVEVGAVVLSRVMLGRLDASVSKAVESAKQKPSG